MAFPVSGILDTGVRANEGPPPSSRWITGVYAADTGWQITSNQLAPEAAGTNKSAVWTAEFNECNETYAKIDAFPTTGDSLELYVNLRDADTATPDGYCMRFWHHSGGGVGAIELDRVDNGVNTRLFDESATLSVSDQFGIQVDKGIIRVWVNGVEKTNFAEVDATYSGKGKLGIRQLGSTGSATRLTDFGGGSMFDVYYVPRPLLTRMWKFGKIGRRFPGFPDLDFPPGTPSVDITVNHVIGSLTLSSNAHAPQLSFDQVIGTLNLTAGTQAPGVAPTPSVGVLTLTDNPPTLTATLAPSVGVLNLTYNAPTIFSGILVVPTVGVLSLTAGTQVPVLGLTPGIGVLTLTSNAHVVGVTGDKTIVAVTGILRLLGDGPTLGGDIIGISTQTTTSRGGPSRRPPILPPQFVQILFDKVKTTTQRITDVLK